MSKFAIIFKGAANGTLFHELMNKLILVLLPWAQLSSLKNKTQTQSFSRVRTKHALILVSRSKNQILHSFHNLSVLHTERQH